MIKYIERNTLQNRGPVDSEPDSQVETFLCSEVSVLIWDDNHSSTGNDSNFLFPAWSAGKRAFLRRSIWCPSQGYSSSGTQESIISFEDGIKILAENQVPPW